MKYYVSVTETLNKVVSVEAENEKQAMQLVQDAYDNSEIILDSDNFCGVEIGVEDNQSFYTDSEKDGPVYQEVKP